MSDHYWHDDHHDDAGGYDEHADHSHPGDESDGYDDSARHFDDDVPELPHHQPDAHGDTRHDDTPHDDTPHGDHHDADQPDEPLDPAAGHTIDGGHPDDGGHEFPPAVDIGPLPDPVDGFPWIDTATLGDAPAAYAAPTEPVDPHDLAAYAAADLPEDNPWTALAGNDDPATAALARWWSENRP